MARLKVYNHGSERRAVTCGGSVYSIPARQVRQFSDTVAKRFVDEHGDISLNSAPAYTQAEHRAMRNLNKPELQGFAEALMNGGHPDPAGFSPPEEPEGEEDKGEEDEGEHSRGAGQQSQTHAQA